MHVKKFGLIKVNIFAIDTTTKMKVLFKTIFWLISARTSNRITGSNTWDMNLNRDSLCSKYAHWNVKIEFDTRSFIKIYRTLKSIRVSSLFLHRIMKNCINTLENIRKCIVANIVTGDIFHKWKIIFKYKIYIKIK